MLTIVTYSGRVKLLQAYFCTPRLRRLDDLPPLCFNLGNQEGKMKSFHTAVQIDHARWAVTFICEFDLLSGTRVMSSAEFIEMITAEAQFGGDNVKPFDDRLGHHPAG